MPNNTQMSHAPLSYDGSYHLSPPLSGNGTDFDHRIVIEGTFRFAHTGEEFDALYRYGTAADTSAAGASPLRHEYLGWTPATPVLMSEDPALHRYVFRIPREWRHIDGQSVGVRIDVDRFVSEYLITPSEVRRQLSGDLRVTVLQTPLAVGPPWGLYAAVGAPAALVMGGVGWTIHRRRMLAGLPADLQETIGRILHKARLARAAVARQDARLLPLLRERIDALADGALALARQTADLRNAQRLADRRTLETDIHALMHRLDILTIGSGEEGPPPPQHEETRATLEEKRKALARLDEMAQAEAHAMMRLAKIEAALDSTILSLRSTRAAASTPPSEESLRRTLDAEVAALREATREAAPALQQTLLRH